VSPVKYELGFYIPEDAILHSPRRENLKSYSPADLCCKVYYAAPIRIFQDRFR
jgi:hypothetical protein